MQIETKTMKETMRHVLLQETHRKTMFVAVAATEAAAAVVVVVAAAAAVVVVAVESAKTVW